VLAEVVSVRGHRICLTLRQWLHISENYDYMAGNRSLVLETIADPNKRLIGEASETLAFRVRAKGIQMWIRLPSTND
jgi:hypothetical protein